MATHMNTYTWNKWIKKTSNLKVI